MRLIRAQVVDILIGGDVEKTLQIVVDDEDVRHELSIPLPDNWDAWLRTEKVQWVRAWVVEHAQTHKYTSGAEVVYPDASVKEQALTGFDGLPGFATWTAQEATVWIDESVIDLVTAKNALSRTARALVYLRDIVIQRI